MAPKIGNMRISGFVAGIILTVLGALIARVANTDSQSTLTDVTVRSVIVYL